MNVQTVFAAMKAIVEAPGYPLLQAYKEDFYKCDHAWLQHHEGAQGLRFLWFVRLYGSDMTALGIHKKVHERGLAILESNSGSPYKIYLVDGDSATVKEVSREAALVHLGKYDYDVKGRVITRRGQQLASIEVEITPWSAGHEPKGNVTMKTFGSTPLSQEALLALYKIATSEIVVTSGSLFTKVGEVTLNGVDLYDTIEARRTLKLAA